MIKKKFNEWVQLILLVFVSLVLVTSCDDGGNTAIYSHGPLSEVYKATVFAKRSNDKSNDIKYTFGATVSGDTINFDIPVDISNTTYWKDISISFNLPISTDDSLYFQINETGEKLENSFMKDVKGSELKDIKTIKAGNGAGESKVYTVTFTDSYMVFYDQNTEKEITILEEIKDKNTYKTGEKLRIYDKELEQIFYKYKHLGWATNKNTKEPEYLIGEEITLKASNTCLYLYAIWSEYKIGDKISSKDIFGKDFTDGYVAYIRGSESKNDGLEIVNPDDKEWRYLVFFTNAASGYFKNIPFVPENTTTLNAETSLALGAGYKNTTNISADQTGETVVARIIGQNYYLPSKQELEFIFQQSGGIGYALNQHYMWTSSLDGNGKVYVAKQSDLIEAKAFNFYIGNEENNENSITNVVGVTYLAK